MLVNTGDFIDFGWREFESMTQYYQKQKVDMVILPFSATMMQALMIRYFTEADRENNILIMNNLIKLQGIRS